ncbi:hypothetical protein NDU88_005764 [Pleurodeles waltl]|uniref:Uncharacterized protein n=1 Tax=Pleurodeles waltl TaxID=8319 RepID=A0AAV7NPZ5_PLEWA|nr:hypothetical protein NDU88_005764 [Pleurodeles waltl]
MLLIPDYWLPTYTGYAGPLEREFMEQRKKSQNMLTDEIENGTEARVGPWSPGQRQPSCTNSPIYVKTVDPGSCGEKWQDHDQGPGPGQGLDPGHDQGLGPGHGHGHCPFPIPDHDPDPDPDPDPDHDHDPDPDPNPEHQGGSIGRYHQLTGVQIALERDSFMATTEVSLEDLEEAQEDLRIIEMNGKAIKMMEDFHRMTIFLTDLMNADQLHLTSGDRLPLTV